MVLTPVDKDEAEGPGGPWVRVVIVNYNGGDYLQRAVDCLGKQTMADFETVIVDNGSTDGSIENLTLPDNRFKVITPGSNLGFAAGNNLGAEGCTAPWIITLNPDAFPEPDWLAELKRATEQYPGVEMFGSTQIDAKDPSRIDGCGDVYSIYGIPWRGGHGHDAGALPADGEVFSPCAAAALYSRPAFEIAGGFDESFFCYLEDVDLGLRIRLTGGKCIHVSKAVVRHVGSASTGRASDFTVYHSYRNRLWLMVKCIPWPLLAIMLPLNLAATLFLLIRIPEAGNRRAGFRGLVDAVKGLGPVLKARGGVHRQREISSLGVASALTWDLGKLRSRDMVIKPISINQK